MLKKSRQRQISCFNVIQNALMWPDLTYYETQNSPGREVLFSIADQETACTGSYIRMTWYDEKQQDIAIKP